LLRSGRPGSLIEPTWRRKSWWPSSPPGGTPASPRSSARPIAPEDKAAIEDFAAYLINPPVSLEKLVYLDGEKAMHYRSRMNPGLGRNFEAMYPLAWLARMADHIPDPGKHRTLLYGVYSNRARGAGERRSRVQKQPRSASGARRTGRG